MKAPPTDLVTADLVDALQVHWQLEVGGLDYLAVGFGAHHWGAVTATGARYFLALHELGHAGGAVDLRAERLARLQQAFSAAYWLETAVQLEFVVGPVKDVSGTYCRPVSERFALAVYRWLDCEPMCHPDDPQTAEVLARLHAVAPGVPPGLVRTEDYRIPHRVELEDALMDLGQAWRTGPYAAPMFRRQSPPGRLGLSFDRAAGARSVGASAGWAHLGQLSAAYRHAT